MHGQAAYPNVVDGLGCRSLTCGPLRQRREIHARMHEFGANAIYLHIKP